MKAENTKGVEKPRSSHNAFIRILISRINIKAHIKPESHLNMKLLLLP